MSQSNLLKVVGKIGGDLVTIEGRMRDSGWALIMPETPEATSNAVQPPTPLVNMMKWVTGKSFGAKGEDTDHRFPRRFWDVRKA